VLGVTWGQKLGRSECPYIRRWVFNFLLFSIRIHHWYYSDDSRYFHDHPWWFVTLVLKGGYTDVSPTKNDTLTFWSIRWRSAYHRHYVAVNKGGCWTVMLTGPALRQWGFWVKGKFLRSAKYFHRFNHHPCEN
jgi:hypothetical protein